MVRPRLVEEGVPVGSTETEIDDHPMEDDDLDEEHHRRHQRHACPQHHHDRQVPSNRTPARDSYPQHPHDSKLPRSSLQVASGGKDYPQRLKRRHATRVVIGVDGADVLMQQGSNDRHFFHTTDKNSHQHQAMMHPTHYQVPGTHQMSGSAVFGNSDGGQQAGAGATTAYPNHVPQHYSHQSASHKHQLHDMQHYANYACGFSAHDAHNGHSESFPMPTGVQQVPHPYSHAHHAASAVSSSYASGPPAVRTHVEIGADYRPTERMQGVEDHEIKPPLVVFDGANIAYAYAQALQGGAHPQQQQQQHRGKNQLQPDARGIQVASQYFQDAGMRVLIVLPQPWFRARTGNNTFQQLSLQGLEDLQKAQGHQIVAAPPTDDDDAYALTIARRESLRVHPPGGIQHGHGFVLSNDLFRDAAARDETGSLQEWLSQGMKDGTGAGRISFAFCDMGNMDDYGDRMLDFVPNPRHALVSHIESSRLQAIKQQQQHYQG